MIVQLVGKDKVVLDVGCAAGDTALALTEAGCHVSGVDIEDAVPDERRDLFQKLLVADIEKAPLTTLFEPGTFDVVVFGDVLEHLVDPEASLADAVQLLGPDGHVVVSIPNVAHAAVRLALLGGRWTYTEKGLLDATHLRFFTRETVCDLLEGAGLVIEELHATILDPFDAEVDFDTGRIPPAVVEWVRHQPDAMNFQYVAAARLLRDGESRPERPQLQAAVSPVRARHRDEHTTAAEAEQDERHEALITRDHVIGLEAQTAAALSRQRTAEDKMSRLNARARRLRDHLDGLIEEIDRLPSWRTGRKLRERARSARSPRGRDA
ncbi:MAG TPA: class I SAM-dependent methyltransferase [Nocardioides sp.]|uniref:class I SAM-dependent methyltransferase n=1 Tax=Nocardioides sp. TaxID=35761 RepID=UPI002E33612B|nr:class I SAM-dependent methyltransferase [Nocardioides sp.]HEX5089857.1 class I SAM-dependent methyltransferase [Nocardioides sp.]